ncbi:diguanylate cyclase [Comamonas aquatica]|uniref:diguanylate cyclase n=1 Tax=Comamonas aquatica TaxID=225991 RepID=UPI0034D6E07D
MRPALDFAIALDIRDPFLQASQYFSLIVPVCGVLLGLALVACWTVLRQQRYLLWLAAAYILPAVPLAAQTLMSNEQLARTAVLLGAFYLSGLWAMAQGMALKYGGAAHPRLAAVVGVLALGLLYYFSQVTDQLRIRILVLNLAMVLLLLLGVMAVYRQRRPVHGLERLLRASYLVFVAYSVLRPAIVAVFLWEGPLPELSSSPLWLLMLALNLLLSLWFIAVLLAVSVREMFVILKHERDRDSLTQLLNRRAFFEQAPTRMRQPGGQWALVVCDVDHFKHINDNLGHGMGDEVLKLVAQVLVQHVRQDDLVVRFGGEEFVLMLRCTDLEGAVAVVQRMREQLALESLRLLPQPLTASFGVVMCDAMASLQTLLQHADALLYEAKRAGRNRVVSSLVALSHPAEAPAVVQG